MSAQPQPRLTPEQHLELDRASEFRNEYYNGRMYATSGGSIPHVVIIGNLTFAIRGAIRGRGCVVVSSDARVRISSDGLYTYSDVVVVCGEPQYVDNRKDTLTNPILIGEVLSPSTEAYDRGFKSAQYRQLASLQEYVLISQTEPRIEVYRRRPQGDWLLTESVGLSATCHLENLACDIPLAEIYAQVTFSIEEPPQE